MDESSRSRSVLKIVLQVAAALVVVAALTGLTAYAWQAQGRSKENVSMTWTRLRKRQSQVARSLLPLVDRVDEYRRELATLTPADPAYAVTQEKLTSVQNVIASEVPELIWFRDGQGNVLIVDVGTARTFLQARIAAYQKPSKK